MRAAAVEGLIEVLGRLEQATLLDGVEDPQVRLATAMSAWAVSRLEPEELPAGRDRLDLLLETAELGRELLDPLLSAWLDHELAGELIERGLREDAAEVVEARIARREQAPEAHPWLLDVRADLERRRGEFGVALATIEEAVSEARALLELYEPQPTLEAFLLTAEARILADVGLPDEALGPMERAHGLAPAHGDGDLEEALLQMDLLLDFTRNRYETVVERIEALGELPLGRYSLYLALARSELALRELRRRGEGSLAEVREGIEVLLREGSLSRNDRLDAWKGLAELDLAEGNAAAARTRLAEVDAALADGGAVESFVREGAFLAEMHGRAALAAGAPPEELGARREALERAYGALLDAWDSVPPREGGVGFLHYEERRAVLATLVRLTLEREPETGPLRAVEEVLRSERRGSLAAALGHDGLDLDAVERELLGPGRGVLVILPSSDVSLAIALDENGAAVIPLGSSDAWARTRSRLAGLASNPSEDLEGDLHRISVLAGELARQLLPAELDARVSGWDELTVVGLESLAWVPLELLPLAGRGGRPLGLELAIGYAPSMIVGARLARRAAERAPPAAEEGLIAVLAVEPASRHDPYEERDLLPIPWAPEHAARLNAPWAEERVLVALEPEAARGAIENAAARGARLLEVYAHGLSDDARGRSAGLAIGPRERGYTWEDIAALRAPPLVSLAVCGAGRGRVRLGDAGATHLGGAFLLAGCDVVLLSAADLSFQASVAFNEVVRRELSHGASPARALLAARRVLAADPLLRHPGFYARVHAIGFAHAPLAGLPASRVPPGGAAAGATTTGNRPLLAGLVLFALLGGAAGLLLARTRRPAA